MPAPIIYIHFGTSDYLQYTLRSATITNPSTRRILIGDKYNKDIALSEGWEFFELYSFHNELIKEFKRVYVTIAGPKNTWHKERHPSIRDWQSFTFLRWLIIEEFCRRENIKGFWTFDSDVLILKNLSSFWDRLVLRRIDGTTLCRGSCLNGFMNNRRMLRALCRYFVGSFKNKKLLNDMREEFMEEGKQGWAYSEMRGYLNFHRDNPQYNIVSLEDPYAWFCSCVYQDEGFIATRSEFVDEPNLNNIEMKLIKYDSDNKEFYGMRLGEKVPFATLNVSWIGVDMIKRVMQHL